MVSEPKFQQLDRLLAEENLESLLITAPPNIRYLCGFSGVESALLVVSDQATLIVDFRYLVQAKQEAKGVAIYQMQDGLVAALQELVGHHHVRRLGFESDHLSFKEVNNLQTEVVGCELIPTSGLVEHLRQSKNNEEVGLIQQALTIAEAGFRHVLEFIKPGVAEKDLALELEFYMRKHGAEGVAFDLIVASGSRAALPHATPTSKRIRNREWVLFDLGARYCGYNSDLTRTVWVGPGPPDSTNQNMYSAVLSAQREAITKLRAGLTGKEADAIARQVLEAAGYGRQFGHSLGHGVGLEIHEEPHLSPRNPNPLPRGAVVTVEPGVYLEDVGGVRIEDMVILKENDCQVLTCLEKDLLVI